MAYVSPPNFEPDDPLEADQLNVLGEDIEYLKDKTDGSDASGCQVSRAANQSIGDSSDENVSWDTENWDIGGWYSSGTKVIVPSGAIPGGFTTILVHVTGFAKFGTDGTGKRRVQLLKNGSSFGSLKQTAIDDDTTTLYIDEYTTVVAADEIQMNVWQSSGGALNVTLARMTVVRHAPVS